MILRLFKSNQPYVLIFLPLIALIFWGYAFFNYSGTEVQYGGPLFNYLLSLTAHSNWLSSLISLIVVLLSAIILNGLYNQHEFTDRGNYLPALLFLFFNSFYIALVGLTPIQFANLFILLVLRRILLMYHQNSVFSELYDSGALLGMASLFYPPILITFPFIWTALIILRPFFWREWILPVLGVITPYIFVFAYYFWVDKSFEWQQFFQVESFTSPDDLEGYLIFKWIFGGLMLFITVAGLILFLTKMSTSTINRKNKKQIFLSASFFLLLCFLYTSFLPGPSRTEIALLSIPLAVFASVYFFSASRAILASIIFYLWLIALLLNFYWTWLF